MKAKHWLLLLQVFLNFLVRFLDLLHCQCDCKQLFTVLGQQVKALQVLEPVDIFGRFHVSNFDGVQAVSSGNLLAQVVHHFVGQLIQRQTQHLQAPLVDSAHFHQLLLDVFDGETHVFKGKHFKALVDSESRKEHFHLLNVEVGHILDVQLPQLGQQRNNVVQPDAWHVLQMQFLYIADIEGGIEVSIVFPTSIND